MSTDFAILRRTLRVAAICWVASGCAIRAEAGDPETASRVRRAISYLDARQDEWSQFAKSQRGEGANRTACVSCHTGLSYAFARPLLRPFAETPGPATPERRMITAVRLRNEHWAGLDSPQFRLMYDHDNRKEVESRGTEAVLNSLILALDDAGQRRVTPSLTAQTALKHLWATQTREGGVAGSWDWLNFGLEPWEGKGSQAFGAALAAIAVGSAPGYLGQPLDEEAKRGVGLLRDYLAKRFPEESLYNRIWILKASWTFDGLLSADQKNEVIKQLLAVRREDGGWALADLGTYQRVDGTTQSRESDGYATGLALHAILHAGTTTESPEVVQGMAWLRSHQQVDGSWTGRSLNKERDSATFIGRLMTDAATAMAATVLTEAESR